MEGHLHHGNSVGVLDLKKDTMSSTHWHDNIMLHDAFTVKPVKLPHTTLFQHRRPIVAPKLRCYVAKKKKKITKL